MAATTKPVLREFQPLTNVLQTVPQRLQKGLFSQDVEWTCLDVTKEFLAIGTNVGIVFLYDRQKRTVERLQCPGDDTVVTCVSLQSSIDYVIGVGTESAHVYIFQLPSIIPDGTKQLQMFRVENVHQEAVQCLAWSLNTMKLFSGDIGGNVVCTEIDYVEEKCRSYEVCHESHPIVQLHYAYKTLLVSTLSRAVLCFVNDSDARIVQVGQKQRKGLDAYGSAFLLGSYQAKDAILFAARPGLRIWKACGETGVVQATYIFRDLMMDPSQGIELLPDTVSDCSPGCATDRQFGRLLLFNDTQLVTYRGTRLCVVDPGLGQFVGYHGNLGYISSVAVCSDEIFVLRKVDSGRRLLRLGFTPELSQEVPRLLGAESHIPQTTLGSTPSPVHAIVHSASVMSRGIVGALKGVGDMLHSSVQEGQITSSSTNQPPWGVVGSRNADANTLPHSESIDSAKEASPGNVPSPSSEGSGKGVTSVAAPLQNAYTSRSSVPLDKAEPEEVLIVEVYETQSRHIADDTTTEAVSQGNRIDVGVTATLSMTEVQAAPSIGDVMQQSQHLEKKHLPEKFLAVGDHPYEDIVFSSHTKKRKKKKAIHAVKEKDLTSVSSVEDATSSCDNVTSSQSHNHLLTPKDGSVPYISAKEEIDRVSPSSQHNDPATQNSQCHEESALATLSGHLSETSISDVDAEHELIASEKLSVQRTEPDDSDSATGEMCRSKTEPSPVIMPGVQLQTHSPGLQLDKTCETELSRGHATPQNRPDILHTITNNLAADDISSKQSCEAVSHTVEQSADLPQMSGEKSRAETLNFMAVTQMEQLGDQVVGVKTPSGKGQYGDNTVVTESSTDPSHPNVDLATKSWFTTSAALPTESTEQPTVIKQCDITPLTSPSDKSDISCSRINTSTCSPVESPDDFYSKYRHFGRITTDSEAGVSIEQVLEQSAKNDDGSAYHGSEAVVADTWSEFLMSDKFEGLLSMGMSERHIWCVDKHEAVTYSRTNKQQLNWQSVSALAHQLAVSSSGAIMWRLYKGSVYVALCVTPSVPVGTKWNEVVREVKHIAVDDAVAWYVKVTGELMMQKGLCRERPSFRSIPVPCVHKIHQVACYSGIVWVLTKERHLLVRTGIEPGREEGAAWKEVGSDGSCPEAVSFDFGNENSVWLLDTAGHLWFTVGVTPQTPEGVGDWWQVSLSPYVMHDMTLLDVTHDTLRSLTSKLLGGYAESEMTGVLACRHSGVWLWSPSNGKKIIACRGMLTGHQWRLVTPSGLPASVKWVKLSLGCVSGDKEGYVWLQLLNGDIFCLLPSSKKLIEVAPPVSGRAFSCISGTRDALWGLLANGGVYIRAAIGGRCVQGRSWAKQIMVQLGDAHLVSVSCGTQNVLVVDNTGQVYLRIGVKAPDKHHLCPAWVPVDGTTSMAGSRFTSIYTSPADWLIWVLDSRNCVYVRKGITDDLPIGTHWLYVPGIQATSLCISNEFVYALTPEGKIYVRYAINPTNPAGNYWKEIPGRFFAFAVTANDDLWALDESGQLYRRTVQHIQCDQHQYTRIKSTVSVDEGWELI